MAKKSKRNSQRRNLINLTNIILFILLVLAVVWIFSSSSMKKSSNLKGELGTYGPDTLPELVVISEVTICDTDDDCPEEQPFCDDSEGICVECIWNGNCPAGKLCGEEGTCEECITDEDCNKNFPDCTPLKDEDGTIRRQCTKRDMA